MVQVPFYAREIRLERSRQQGFIARVQYFDGTSIRNL